jgi:hypothetical protein
LGILAQAYIKPKKAAIKYDYICTIAISNIKMHMLPTNATDNNIIASNYNFSLVAIERRLHDKTFMTPTTSVAKKVAQQTYRFAWERHVIGVGNTLFALVYCVPTLASLYCETCQKNLIKKHIVDGLFGGRVATIWCSYKLSSFGFSGSTLHWTFWWYTTVSY